MFVGTQKDRKKQVLQFIEFGKRRTSTFNLRKLESPESLHSFPKSLKNILFFSSGPLLKALLSEQGATP